MKDAQNRVRSRRKKTQPAHSRPALSNQGCHAPRKGPSLPAKITLPGPDWHLHIKRSGVDQAGSLSHLNKHEKNTELHVLIFSPRKFKNKYGTIVHYSPGTTFKKVYRNHQAKHNN